MPPAAPAPGSRTPAAPRGCRGSRGAPPASRATAGSPAAAARRHAGPVRQRIARHEADARARGHQLPVGHLIVAAQRELLAADRLAHGREACSGRTMRTAMSASRRSRWVSWLDATSSTVMSGSARCSAASTGGSSQQAGTTLVVTRTVPRVVSRVRSSAGQRHRAGVHLPRRVGDRQRRRGGHHAAAGALEHRHAQLRLQFGHVARQRGLAGVQPARGAHHAAGVRHRQEAAHQRPVEPVDRGGSGRLGHAKVHGPRCRSRRPARNTTCMPGRRIPHAWSPR